MIADRGTPVCSLAPSLLMRWREWAFALFLHAGSCKADPRLGFIRSRADIILVFIIVSFLAFFLHGVRKVFRQHIRLLQQGEARC